MRSDLRDGLRNHIAMMFVNRRYLGQTPNNIHTMAPLPGDVVMADKLIQYLLDIGWTPPEEPDKRYPFQQGVGR